ncbi:MAG: nuclear transport factor 2 family protein [Acidimicrobiia bacterium]
MTNTEVERITRQVVEKLYRAYFDLDPDGMLATMSDDVEVRFLGRGVHRGIDEARRFLSLNTGLLEDLDFRIRSFIVDGEYVAAVWDESAVTTRGDSYENHGVDVFRVVDGEIAIVHVNNDVVVRRRHFGSEG